MVVLRARSVNGVIEKKAVLQTSKTAFQALGFGRGGRDRTYAYRNQNPVPYHLATPLHTTSLANKLAVDRLTAARLLTRLFSEALNYRRFCEVVKGVTIDRVNCPGIERLRMQFRERRVNGRIPGHWGEVGAARTRHAGRQARVGHFAH